MKKSLALLLITALASSIAVSGCSKTSSDSKKAAKDSNGQIKLSITWWGSQSRHDYTQKLLKMYTKKHPNVTFEATPAGWDGYFDKMSAQAAGGSMPDIVQMDYSYIDTFANNKTLADLSSYVNDNTIDLNDVDKTLVDSGKINGKLDGIVLSSSALALTYNPDVFKKAGVAEPKAAWTWNEFVKDMTTIQKKTGEYGIDKIEPINYFPYWVRQYGKEVFSADGKKLGYDDDKIFVDFVKMIQKLQNAKAIPTPDQWTQISAKGKEAEPVVTGKGGATFDWSNYGVIVEKSNPNLKIITPPYSSSGTKALWNKPGMFFSVAQSSTHKKAAAEFINWFINDVEANKVINAERGVPVSSKIRESLKPSLTPQQKAMFDYTDDVIANSSSVPAPDPAGAAEVWKLMTDTVNSVLYNNATPEKAAVTFRAKANEILARGGSN